MTNKEAIKLLNLIQAEMEWDYPMDYAAAIDMAISALQAQDSKTRRICDTCKHDPPSKKCPCVDCDMREPADRWEAQDVPTINVGDMVSRQKAIDALDQIFDRCEEIESHLPEGDPDRTGYKMYPDYMTVWKYLHQLSSAQPPVPTCDGCRHVGTYNTNFPCSECIRREKDYYEQER